MNTITGFTFYDSLNKLTVGTLLLLLLGGMIGEKAETNILFEQEDIVVEATIM